MKKAFSLIELSIIIVVIGIIIAGVIQASELWDKSKITSAQTLTQSSPVAGIEDLAVWYETSYMSDSYDDGSSVATWVDINPQSSNKTNAPTDGVHNPSFKDDVINNLPALSFASSDTMTFEGDLSKDFTMFVVTKIKDLQQSDASIVSGSGFNFYYSADGASGGGYYVDRTIGGNTTNTYYGHNCSIPTIHTFASSTATGLKYWNNGGVSSDATDSAAGILSGGTSINIGGSSSDIAELIVFSRNITNEERQEVEAYLSRKYGLKKVTNDDCADAPPAPPTVDCENATSYQGKYFGNPCYEFCSQGDNDTTKAACTECNKPEYYQYYFYTPCAAEHENYCRNVDTNDPEAQINCSSYCRDRGYDPAAGDICALMR